MGSFKNCAIFFYMCCRSMWRRFTSAKFRAQSHIHLQHCRVFLLKIRAALRTDYPMVVLSPTYAEDGLMSQHVTSGAIQTDVS